LAKSLVDRPERLKWSRETGLRCTEHPEVPSVSNRKRRNMVKNKRVDSGSRVKQNRQARKHIPYES